MTLQSHFIWRLAVELLQKAKELATAVLLHALDDDLAGRRG